MIAAFAFGVIVGAAGVFICGLCCASKWHDDEL